MEELYYRHYVTVDDRGRILAGWSDGPKPDKDTANALCINDHGGYQFRLTPDGAENPALFGEGNVALYKLVDGKVEARTEEELAADLAALPAPGPTAAERLEAQVVYTAMMTDTMLEVN